MQVVVCWREKSWWSLFLSNGLAASASRDGGCCHCCWENNLIEVSHGLPLMFPTTAAPKRYYVRSDRNITYIHGVLALCGFCYCDFHYYNFSKPFQKYLAYAIFGIIPSVLQFFVQNSPPAFLHYWNGPFPAENDHVTRLLSLLAYYLIGSS